MAAETIRLTHRGGVNVTVPEAKVDGLLRQGFTRAGEATGADDDDASGAPKGNASRDEWATYADSLGVQYEPDAKRDDIKAAIDTATPPADA